MQHIDQMKYFLIAANQEVEEDNLGSIIYEKEHFGKMWKKYFEKLYDELELTGNKLE